MLARAPASRWGFGRVLVQTRAMSTFKLNKTIFNSTLYKQIQDVWFEGQSLDAQNLDERTTKRWFTNPPKERLKFDDYCRSSFGHALAAIGPEQFAKPSAEPFLQVIYEAVQKNPTDQGSEAAWTALSLIILLDQITRNIYRTNEGLRKVYSHYDSIAFSLARHLLSSETPIIRPDMHQQWKESLAYRQWFYMPLMHSEDKNAHRQALDIFSKLEEDIQNKEGLEGTKKFLQATMQAEKEHNNILERFGRYPHRNMALGRESTEEEKKFLEEGGATFGVAQED